MNLNNLNREMINNVKREYPKGTKVVLIKMDDSQAPKIGTKGIVRSVDDAGTIHVNWEGGGSLGVVLGVDLVAKID